MAITIYLTVDQIKTNMKCVKMKGMLPTKVVKPQAEAPIKGGPMKALSLKARVKSPAQNKQQITNPVDWK